MLVSRLQVSAGWVHGVKLSCSQLPWNALSARGLIENAVSESVCRECDRGVVRTQESVLVFGS